MIEALDQEPGYGWPIRQVLLYRAFERAADLLEEDPSAAVDTEMGQTVFRLRTEINEERLRKTADSIRAKRG